SLRLGQWGKAAGSDEHATTGVRGIPPADPAVSGRVSRRPSAAHRLASSAAFWNWSVIGPHRCAILRAKPADDINQGAAQNGLLVAVVPSPDECNGTTKRLLHYAHEIAG